ncbi:MAG: DUF4833 domain-containing protein [Pseudomonadota bacterium]
MAKFLLAALCAVLLSLTAPIAHAVQLTSVEVFDRATLPKVQPSWPVPNDRNQMFYLQRSTNKNTIVYAVRYDGAGNIDASNPVSVYWRRFNTDGAAKGLKSVERRFAYGVNASRRDRAGEFLVTLKPLPQLPMLLRQVGPGRSELWARIGGKSVRATYAYVTIDEGGLIPKVTAFSIFGIDPTTGRAIGETFRVKGGAITQ